ncbi:MAG: hypothetical protein D3909_05085 [Candidatus Electrothrix sp. ATG1]|nr:hypothetical protein [Candidatus Electrothrix sp. ATG1]
MFCCFTPEEMGWEFIQGIKKIRLTTKCVKYIFYQKTIPHSKSNSTHYFWATTDNKHQVHPAKKLDIFIRHA